ncbi:hypothetical protein Droror1_Dr00012204 [Drosera rotundifolia]
MIRTPMARRCHGIDFSVELLFGRMSSGATDPRMDEDNDSVEDEMDGLVSCANKNKRRKAPRRNLKAEREKLKREQLNELFSKLASALEQNEETYGKACIVREAIKFVNDLLSDIQALRKDNADLLSESQYLMAEKNELRDENCTLETQIKNIQNYIAASNDSQVHPIAAKVADPPSIVSKPHARYPTSTDSWTLQLLQK